MNPNICYNCGGEFEQHGSRMVCGSCGSYKPEVASGEELTLLYTAFQKLRIAEFDEAEKEFDDIIRKYPKNPNGYWGRLMSKYGIKYEEDYDGRRIPTCYSASIESVLSAHDFQKVLQYADEENRAYYRKQAEYMERVRKEWIDKASKEKPYDIFICYKESDLARGIERTQDSIAVQDLYIHLTNKGYRVFYSHESLRDKAGEKYEPYIFNALSTAKIMLVYASDPDYITSTWLKNEWTRYEKRLRAGEKPPNSLLVACDGFSPSELPRALACVQCLHANERSFYSDLDDTIEKILHKKEKPPVPVVPQKHTEQNKSISVPPRKSNIPLIAAILIIALTAAIIWVSSSFPQSKTSCEHMIMTREKTEPTCTKEGRSEEQFCGLCGEIFMAAEIIEPLDHRPNGDPSCTEAQHCTECGIKLASPLGHTPGKEATCVEDQICIECHEQLTPAFGHTPEKEATCTEPQYCAVCRDELEPAYGHSYNIHVVDPTCVDQGYTLHECHCGDTYTDNYTGAIGHLADSEATCTEASRCSRCDEILQSENGHLPGEEATCTQAQYCLVCYTEITPVREHVHTPTVTPATCTDPGYTTNTCICGDSYESNHTEPLGHAATEQTCTSPSVCNRCTEELEPALGHSVSSWTVDRALTETVSGIRHGTCETCNETVEVEYTYSQDLAYEENEGSYTVFRGDCTDSLIIIPSVHEGKPVTAIGSHAFQSHDFVTVIIPDTVTVIGEEAFAYCEKLTSCVLPMGVTAILGNAFAGTGITEFTIPNSVITLGNGVFNSCESLQTITVPDSVTSMGYTVFANCKNLTEVIIGNGVSMLDWATFSNCENLTQVTLGSGLKEIGSSAFQNCNGLEYIKIPDSVTMIGESAFSDCANLKTVIFGNGLKTIGEGAFTYCSNLQIAVLPDSVTRIDKTAFFACTSLVSVTLGRNLNSIGEQAFDHCNKLIEVVNHSSLYMAPGSFAYGNLPYYAKDIHGGESKIVKYEDYLFYPLNDMWYLIAYAGNETELILPESCNGNPYRLYPYAFACRQEITSVTLPSSITYIPEFTFLGCTGLYTLRFEGTCAQWESVSLGLSWGDDIPAADVSCSDGGVPLA